MDFFQQLGNTLSEVASVAVVLACAVLWLRRRSGWLLLALIGEIGSFACRLGLMLAPSLYTDMPILRVLWPLNACIFAIGLLGYAWFETEQRNAAAPGSGVQP